MVRSEAENVHVTSMVSGKITRLNLKNNLSVNQGDTQVTDLLRDLALVVQNKSQNLKISAIRHEWQIYQTRYVELLSKKEQNGAVYERHNRNYCRTRKPFSAYFSKRKIF